MLSSGRVMRCGALVAKQSWSLFHGFKPRRHTHNIRRVLFIPSLSITLSTHICACSHLFSPLYTIPSLTSQDGGKGAAVQYRHVHLPRAIDRFVTKDSHHKVTHTHPAEVR
jgi:hypothetical protein